jgi:hypothetical protein
MFSGEAADTKIFRLKRSGINKNNKTNKKHHTALEASKLTFTPYGFDVKK